jgi:hypothetical protein
VVEADANPHVEGLDQRPDLEQVLVGNQQMQLAVAGLEAGMDPAQPGRSDLLEPISS